jgi:hypothetical protein
VARTVSRLGLSVLQMTEVLAGQGQVGSEEVVGHAEVLQTFPTKQRYVPIQDLRFVAPLCNLQFFVHCQLLIASSFSGSFRRRLTSSF